MHYILRLTMRSTFTSMHDSIRLSKIVGIVVMWTTPAISLTLICAVVVSASSGLLPQEVPVFDCFSFPFFWASTILFLHASTGI